MAENDVPSKPGAAIEPSGQSLSSQNTEKPAWWKRRAPTIEDHRAKNRAHEFNGKRGFNGHWFHRPVEQKSTAPFDNAAMLESDEKGRYIYRNQFGQKYHKHDDVATYLSPTNYVPKRLVVQATNYVCNTKLQTGDWRRTHIQGNVPTVLKIAEWALRPSDPDKEGKASLLGRVHSGFRILAVGLPLQILLCLPTTDSWEGGEINDNYSNFPGYHWKWPKYATNPLDMRPAPAGQEIVTHNQSSKRRLLRPRQLIILKDGKWVLDPNPSRTTSYLFISYANMHFDTDHSETGRRMVEDMAAFAAIKAGKQAYWLDYRCRAPEAGPELDADVYRMCDVIRGAYQVVVMLKGDALRLKQDWGSRMWTLPEGLLATGQNVYFCTPEEDSFKITTMNKVEMSGSIWEDTEVDDEDSPTRLLAEHFTGVLTLSRLEILSNAIAALGDRAYKNYHSHTRGDIAYALMGLLHYRIEKEPNDTAFQALARLSLANDSDRLIERMVCLFPDPSKPEVSAFMQLAQPDMYQAHLWDIDPLCQVVGVGDEDNTVMLDGCKAVHIRWKNFPRVATVRHYGMKKLLAELFVRSGAWWFLFGINLTITYAPFITFSGFASQSSLILALELLLGSFFVVGLLLSFIGPYSVRRLYGGRVLESTPNLIAFEGVLPLRKLEPIVFGNNSGRLSYEPSSTPFSLPFRDPSERIGLEPTWISSGNPADVKEVEAALPKGQRLFTLVDTGSLNVSVFAAENPPTVALLCGREGGMLRAVLCSWRFRNDCLVRETVIRMPSAVLEAAAARSWLKVSLGKGAVTEEGKV
ncbi:Uncharacterized protein BP5553_04881 [Venustampulla echinocandica]|uniref:Heterokaryon incompatibility domain-containing protein n=1 Tax=Venustampulla echinocandica TaxID=2656787 RepID=A0A370TPK9_9HELO|nr:Uncharacterized protein BP5553_04881 [Venustampulla echinocandica]RDL37448.1 Uncharacterized protein BP5553_04881 [Venustampulla echinocandica]